MCKKILTIAVISILAVCIAFKYAGVQSKMQLGPRVIWKSYEFNNSM